MYSRGTQIPVFLVLDSASKQALDLVANPESIQICLTRIVNAGFEARKKTDMAMGPQTMAQCQSMAIFWQPAGLQEDNRRVFEGEIKVKADQTPSITYWHLVVRVRLPFPSLPIDNCRESDQSGCSIMFSFFRLERRGGYRRRRRI